MQTSLPIVYGKVNSKSHLSSFWELQALELASSRGNLGVSALNQYKGTLYKAEIVVAKFLLPSSNNWWHVLFWHIVPFLFRKFRDFIFAARCFLLLTSAKKTIPGKRTTRRFYEEFVVKANEPPPREQLELWLERLLSME